MRTPFCQRAEAISLGTPERLAIRSSNCFTRGTTRITPESWRSREMFSDYRTSGLANCNPHRLQPFTGVIRTTRALRIRVVRRNFISPRAGANGISSDTRERCSKDLRIKSSAPPALSLSRVQNSTNSLPGPLVPRTNTGMARGSRSQRRRS